MKIVGCAGIGCCGGDGQAVFADDKAPEMNETTQPLCQLITGMRGSKRQHEHYDANAE